MDVGTFVKNVPLSPVVTGALLYALTKAPEQYRRLLLRRLSEYFSPTAIGRAITTLKWLVALGITRNIHIWLSEIAQNNFRISSERHRYNWPREVAVVTGAASGFGKVMAQGFADNRINVIAVDLRDELPEDLKSNPKIHYYKCDVTDRQAVMDLADHIRREHGDPSILINNAGVAYPDTILNATEKDIKSVFDVNIVSHYWTIQAFLPAMIKAKKGHVVSIASMASFFSPPGLVSYCNTKAAVLSLHDGLIQESRVHYKAPEVKFTVVHPTYARTNIIKGFETELATKGATVMPPEKVANAVVKQVLSGRGKQLVIGEEIGFLAGIRGWPHWLSQAIIHSTDGKVNLTPIAEMKTGGPG